MAGIASVISPPAGKHLAVFAAGIDVSGTVTDATVTSVWAKVVRSNVDVATLAPSLANGWQEVATAANAFAFNNVKGTLTTPLTGNSDNKVVLFPSVSGTLGAPVEVFFIGRPAVEEVVVSARHCIWFSFVTASAPGPGDPTDRELDVTQHKPPSVIVPENVQKIATACKGRWRHHHAVDGADSDVCTDAQGCPNHVAGVTLENAGYRSGAYNSNSIPMPAAIQVGKLIALYVQDDDTTPTAPFAVTGLDTIDPTTIAKVVLASHDGNRWHNNSGSVVVTIDWEKAIDFRHFLRSQGPKDREK